MHATRTLKGNKIFFPYYLCENVVIIVIKGFETDAQYFKSRQKRKNVYIPSWLVVLEHYWRPRS